MYNKYQLSPLISLSFLCLPQNLTSASHLLIFMSFYLYGPPSLSRSLCNSNDIVFSCVENLSVVILLKGNPCPHPLLTVKNPRGDVDPHEQFTFLWYKMPQLKWVHAYVSHVMYRRHQFTTVLFKFWSFRSSHFLFRGVRRAFLEEGLRVWNGVLLTTAYSPITYSLHLVTFLRLCVNLHPLKN